LNKCHLCENKAGLEWQQVGWGINPFAWALKCIMDLSVEGCFCDAVFI